MSPGNAWSRFFAEERDAYVLGLLRLAISALLFLNCGRLILELGRNGYFGAYFHVPMLPEAWVPTSAAYTGLLFAAAAAALFAFLGVWSRAALFSCSSLGLFILCCDRLQYHNNRYALLLLGLLLAFTPCERSFCIARGKRHTLSREARIAPTFARRLFQVQVSLVYLGSAGGKLLDADWRGGQVLLIRFARSADILGQHGVPVPSWLAAILASALFASLAAKVAISSELFIALGSWLPQTRRIALWAGILFHFWIEVTANVELFSWLMAASYLAFVVPELHGRRFEYDPAQARGKRLSRAVRALDWLARFEIAPLSTDQLKGASFRVTNRAGERASGLAGAALLAEALPALFPLWLPLAILARVTTRRSLRSANSA